MSADHTLNTHTLPTSWGGSVDESQDSGGSGNFLSPGVGQGRASPNRSAPLAASARPLRAGALRTKEAGPSAPTRSGFGTGFTGFRRRRPGQHVRPTPGREEGTGAARRRLPAGPAASLARRRPREK